MAPYRINAKEIDHPFPILFRKRHPKLWKVVQWFVGTLSLMGALLAVFPGIHFLGMWFGNDIMHLDVPGAKAGPFGWFIGAFMIISIMVFIFVPLKLGAHLLKDD